MAIVVTQSTVDDADDYFATRLNSAGWTAGSAADKLSALTTAANLLNAMEWAGTPYSPDSAFPRYLPGSTTPTTPVSVLWALYELAIHLLNNPGLMFDEGSVDTLVVGPIQLQHITSASLLPKIVKRYISAYTVASGGVGGGATWWRAN